MREFHARWIAAAAVLLGMAAEFCFFEEARKPDSRASLPPPIPGRNPATDDSLRDAAASLLGNADGNRTSPAGALPAEDRLAAERPAPRPGPSRKNTARPSMWRRMGKGPNGALPSQNGYASRPRAKSAKVSANEGGVNGARGPGRTSENRKTGGGPGEFKPVAPRRSPKPATASLPAPEKPRNSIAEKRRESAPKLGSAAASRATPLPKHGQLAQTKTAGSRGTGLSGTKGSGQDVLRAASAERAKKKQPLKPQKLRRGQARPRQKPPARSRAPASLQEILGKGALHPPRSAGLPSRLAMLRNRRPPDRLPNGQALVSGEPSIGKIEAMEPPSLQEGFAAWEKSDSAVEARWHQAGDRFYLHQGETWGVWDGQWCWMMRAGTDWWTLAGEGQPLVWHQGHWWWRKDGVWFLVHGGQPWAYRWFSRWNGAGIVQPGSNVQIIYSSDETKAAVARPGKDTVLYDLQTGEEIGRIPTKRPI